MTTFPPSFLPSAWCLEVTTASIFTILWTLLNTQVSSEVKHTHTHTKKIILMSSTLFMKRLIVEFVLKQMLFQHQSRKGHKGGNKEEQEATVCEPKSAHSYCRSFRPRVARDMWKMDLYNVVKSQLSHHWLCNIFILM